MLVTQTSDSPRWRNLESLHYLAGPDLTDARQRFQYRRDFQFTYKLVAGAVNERCKVGAACPQVILDGGPFSAGLSGLNKSVAALFVSKLRGKGHEGANYTRATLEMAAAGGVGWDALRA